MTTDEHNAAFERWLGQHAAVLHHVANGFAEGEDRHDQMQELLLAMWRAVPAFRNGSQPATFIFRVAHNAALTWKRSQKNYRKRVDRFEELGFAEAEPAFTPSELSTKRSSCFMLTFAVLRPWIGRWCCFIWTASAMPTWPKSPASPRATSG